MFIVAPLIVGALAMGPRIVRNLDRDWRFLRADVPEAKAVSYDDASWSKVELPHSWNALDGADGGNNYYRGAGWYRRHFLVSPEMREKSVFLRFGAASQVAEVWVNGRRAGSHTGAFGAFCFEVTSLLTEGDNVLALRVDNASNRDITPLEGDFSIEGGLYRDVQLLALNKVSVTPLDDASSGVYLTPTVSASGGEVRFVAKLRNGESAKAEGYLNVTIRDAGGRRVAWTQVSFSAKAGGPTEVSGTLQVDRPHRWDGVRDPYLYRATVEVARNGQTLDRIEQPFGFRTYRIDPEKGLLLNDQPYDWHGVNLHQGRLGVGWAATPAMREEDYRLVRELGATGVRLAHYQHPQDAYDQCDKRGLVAWAEIPLIGTATASPAFEANTQQMLRELVKQNYNHPSVILWSLYNEAYPHNKDEWNLASGLKALAHELDPTRLTTAATNQSGGWPTNWVPDVTAFNRYWGWYGGGAGEWPRALDGLRKETGGKSFGISEYGFGASIYQHEFPPKQPPSSGKWHPEEYQAMAHEMTWPALQARPWIWCKLVWNMFDFASDGRSEGDHLGVNDKGLVTGDRKVRKDAFFYYKAQWSDDPFVHINGRRFTPRPVGETEIKVYSNCESVEIWVNGRSLGAKTPVGGAAVWPGVNLSRGEITLRAVATKGRKTVSDRASLRVGA